MIHEGLEWLQDVPEGRAWLDRLPTLVTECAREWSLMLGEPFSYAQASLALPAKRLNGERVVLKIQYPDRDSEHEAEALARWRGEGAVRLLDHDEGRHALLLERCEPGVHLSSLDPDDAIDVMIGLLPRSWIPVRGPFRHLAEESAWLASELQRDWDGTGRSVDGRLVEAALEAFERLSGTQGDQVLVNQDLHADNVVSAAREPWLVIDPKPLVGEREFGVAAIVRGSELGHSREAVVGRLDRLAGALALDRERVRLWTLAHTVAWGFQSDGPINEHMETATWLLDA